MGIPALSVLASAASKAAAGKPDGYVLGQKFEVKMPIGLIKVGDTSKKIHTFAKKAVLIYERKGETGFVILKDNSGTEYSISLGNLKAKLAAVPTASVVKAAKPTTVKATEPAPVPKPVAAAPAATPLAIDKDTSIPNLIDAAKGSDQTRKTSAIAELVKRATTENPASDVKDAIKGLPVDDATKTVIKNSIEKITDPKQLAGLSTIDNVTVKLSVAGNKNTSNDTRIALAKDADSGVKKSAIIALVGLAGNSKEEISNSALTALDTIAGNEATRSIFDIIDKPTLTAIKPKTSWFKYRLLNSAIDSREKTSDPVPAPAAAKTATNAATQAAETPPPPAKQPITPAPPASVPAGEQQAQGAAGSTYVAPGVASHPTMANKAVTQTFLTAIFGDKVTVAENGDILKEGKQISFGFLNGKVVNINNELDLEELRALNAQFSTGKGISENLFTLIANGMNTDVKTDAKMSMDEISNFINSHAQKYSSLSGLNDLTKTIELYNEPGMSFRKISTATETQTKSMADSFQLGIIAGTTADQAAAKILTSAEITDATKSSAEAVADTKKILDGISDKFFTRGSTTKATFASINLEQKNRVLQTMAFLPRLLQDIPRQTLEDYYGIPQSLILDLLKAKDDATDSTKTDDPKLAWARFLKKPADQTASGADGGVGASKLPDAPAGTQTTLTENADPTKQANWRYLKVPTKIGTTDFPAGTKVAWVKNAQGQPVVRLLDATGNNWDATEYELPNAGAILTKDLPKPAEPAKAHGTHTTETHGAGRTTAHKAAKK